VSTSYIIGKGKVKLSLCFFNWAQHHAGVLGEWRYSSTHSWPRDWMEVSGQLHSPAGESNRWAKVRAFFLRRASHNRFCIHIISLVDYHRPVFPCKEIKLTINISQVPTPTTLNLSDNSLKISHRRHTCNCWHVNNVSYGNNKTRLCSEPIQISHVQLHKDVSLHLRSSHGHHVGIIDGKKLAKHKGSWPLVVWCS
jgi:hypothetical protein